MTFKDEVMMFWICCLVLLSFLVRHFLGAAEVLAHQAAALSLIGLPEMLRLFVGHVR
ncbi:MAG TPA: hypothetical protein VE077_02440 [Candidatus Methylomirabilis sp.]|nr:hypothetical protein [Candidatus Methylomirabilis sp.]